MNIERLKNIDEIIATKEAYLGQEIDKTTYDRIKQGYILVKNLPEALFQQNRGQNVFHDDTIMEFSIYDASNNVLDQKDYGSVRYIQNMGNANSYITDYLIPSQAGDGWLIDVKTLIKEAGFTTGYFRVQINFVRNRVGDNNPINKVYVQEISPSRTEVRLLYKENEFQSLNSTATGPSANISTFYTLVEQYESFRDGKFPYDEVITDTIALLNNVGPLLTYGTGPFVQPASINDEIQKELGISSITQLINNLVAQIPKDVSFFNSGIVPIPSDPNNAGGSPRVYYGKEDIIQGIVGYIRVIVENIVSQRVITTNVVYDQKVLSSLDALTNTVQTLQSNTTYTLPNIQRVIIDPKAPPPGPTAIEQAPSASNATTPIGTIITSPSIYSYELTDCSDATVKITGTSATPKYGSNSFIYNGKCYSITSTRVSTTYAYLATNVNLDTLVNQYDCGSCIAALIGNPPVGTTLAFVVNPYVVLSTQDTIEVTWATNAPTIGTVTVYYGSNNMFFTSGISGVVITSSTVSTFGTSFSISLGGLTADTWYAIDFALTGQDGQQVSNYIWNTKTQPAGPTIPGSGVTTTDYFVLADCDFATSLIYGYSTAQYQIGDVVPIGGVCYTVTAVQALNAAQLGINPINLDQYYANVTTACLPCKNALGGGTTTAGGGTTTTNNITVNSGDVTSPTTTTTTATTGVKTAGQYTINGITYDSNGNVISTIGGSTVQMN